MIQLTRQMWNLANWEGVLEMLRHRVLQGTVSGTWTCEYTTKVQLNVVEPRKRNHASNCKTWLFCHRRLVTWSQTWLEWAANLVTCSAHTAQSGSIPDCDLHGSWRSIHIISDDIMKALPRLVAEEILGLLRDATRTERQQGCIARFMAYTPLRLGYGR